jgi:hypothetical protein
MKNRRADVGNVYANGNVMRIAGDIPAPRDPCQRNEGEPS